MLGITAKIYNYFYPITPTSDIWIGVRPLDFFGSYANNLEVGAAQAAASEKSSFFYKIFFAKQLKHWVIFVDGVIYHYNGNGFSRCIEKISNFSWTELIGKRTKKSHNEIVDHCEKELKTYKYQMVPMGKEKMNCQTFCAFLLSFLLDISYDSSVEYLTKTINFGGIFGS